MKFIHIRQFKPSASFINKQAAQGKNPLSRGGVTIAYTPATKGTFKVAYAVCSEQDNYCKQTGRDIATQHMLDGNVILIEVDHDHNTVGQIIDTLEAFFDYQVIFDDLCKQSLKILKRDLASFQRAD